MSEPDSRVSDLVSMSAALTRQLQQAGPDDPKAPELADAAIAYNREARTTLGSGDPRRVTVLFNLGLLLVMRRISFHGGDADQEEAIGALDEYLAAPETSREQDDARPDVARLTLGWLLLHRALRLPDPGDMLGRPDLHRILVSLLGGYSPGPEAARDIARAVEVLGDVVASPALTGEIRATAVMTHACAKVLHGLAGPPGAAAPGDPLAALTDLMRDIQTLAPDTPGRAELIGLHAWLNAEHIRTSGAADPGGAARLALEESARQITPGHMLRAVLELELGLTAANQAQRHGGERLRDAVDHITRARADLIRWPDHPMYDDNLRLLTGTLLTATAWEPSPAAIEKTINLARQLLADRDPGDAGGIARDTYLLGMAYTIRASSERRAEDWQSAATEMRRALSLVPADDPMRAPMLATYGAVLNDHFQTRGSLSDAEAARSVFDAVTEILDQPAPDQFYSADDILTLIGLRGICRISLGWRTQDLPELYRGQADVERALAGLPDEYPWRSRLLGALGMAKMTTGVLREDYAQFGAGATTLVEAAAETRIDEGSRIMLRAAGAAAQVMDGRLKADDGAISQGIATLAEVVAEPGMNGQDRLRTLALLGYSHQMRHLLTGDSEELDLCIARMEQARARSDPDLGDPEAAQLLWSLAEAYHHRAEPDDRESETETGMAALQAHVLDVVLQREAAHSLVVARGAADRAVTLARWLHVRQRHEAAIEALELGRGMVLNAATISALIPEILVTAGHAGLAAEWERAARESPTEQASDPVAQSGAMIAVLSGTVLPVQELPGGLRRRVVSALREHPDFSRRFTPPGTAETAAALRAAGADVLAYLVPGSGTEPGMLLTVFADETVLSLPAGERSAAGEQVLDYAEADHALRRVRAEGDIGEIPAAEDSWREALDAVTAWAWTAVLGPILGAVRRKGLYRAAGRPLPRLVLVPVGLFGVVPWHAAWTAGDAETAGATERTYACQRAVFTYAASARQFTDTARRESLPPGSDAVFVADPTHTLAGAMFQTRALRGRLYPGSLGYGWTGEPGERQGTAEQVLAHLPGPDSAGASLLQFACHGVSSGTPMASYLALAAAPDQETGTLGTVSQETAAPEADGKLQVHRILRHAYAGRDLSAPGGLVVLSACVSDLTPGDYDEAMTLSTAFLAAGATGVVGSRWEVSGRVTPALMFMFHYFLRREDMTAADALQATQEWALDPGRAIPPDMDPVIRDGIRTHECADIAAWAAFTHQGR